MFRARQIHLPYFTRSLRVRLLLMVLLIVLVTVGIVALFTSHNTAGSFRVYVSAKQQTAFDQAMNSLNAYNIASNDQPDQQIEQEMVVQIGKEYSVRVVVVNLTNQVIASNETDLLGSIIIREKSQKIASDQPAPDANGIPCITLSAPTDPGTIVLATNSSVLCSNISQISYEKSIGFAAPEQVFLNAVNGTILFSAILAGLIALLLSLAFSYTIIKPIRRMTGVARCMAGGDLSQRLKVRTYHEISELAHALNTMAHGLQRSERLRRNLINDIAHELRTPLTNIRGYLEALQDQVIDPTPATIALLSEESTLLTRLVNDLQELSLAEAGQLCLIRRPVALNECVLKAVQTLQLRASQKGIALSVDLPHDIFWVEVDPERLAQILRNLIGNAIIHTPTGGAITVSVTEGESEVLVSVQDNGCGIEEQHLPYVFERFYRADPSRTRATGGTGLGLAIVKQMVQAHGGQVSVKSQPGQGSCFAFTLPLQATGALPWIS